MSEGLQFFSLKKALELASKKGKPLFYLLKDFSLENKFPLVFKKNFGSLTKEEQKKLMISRVLVLGCGGLGGFLIESLARLGVGNLIFADGDQFEETNLNRQLFCNTYNLGKNKAKEAEKRIKEIAPYICVNSISNYLDIEIVKEYSKDCNVVVDCTGGIEFKKELIYAFREFKKPLVTAAVAGYEGFVTTITENSKAPIEYFLGKNKDGAEHQLGVLIQSVAIASALQTQEVLSILLKNTPKLENRLLYFSLQDLFFEIFSLSER